jgi:RimJ/RimL family protein N-acetyltransferase
MLASMSDDRKTRPLGDPVDFVVPPRPAHAMQVGEHVILRALDPAADAAALYPLLHAPTGDPAVWDYLPDGPFPDIDSYRSYLEAQAASEDPLFFAITAREERDGQAVPGEALGVLSLLSIVPEHGRIEVGHICFSPKLQRTVAATEAIFLVGRYAMDELGYRRYEWKCNALNAPSRSAALRYGFLYEGTFAQHQIVKGRNRDTAWYAITDGRWPAIREAFAAWLAPANFDADGQQRRSLRELTQAAG